LEKLTENYPGRRGNNEYIMPFYMMEANSMQMGLNLPKRIYLFLFDE
jgi:hypothetical protein